MEILLWYCRSFKKGEEHVERWSFLQKKIENLVKERDKEEGGNENVDNCSLAEALPTPKKRTRTKKRWFFFWLSLSSVTLPFVTVP